LLEHPFLRFYVDNGQQQVMQLPQQRHPNPVQRTGPAMPYQIPTLALSQSQSFLFRENSLKKRNRWTLLRNKTAGIG